MADSAFVEERPYPPAPRWVGRVLAWMVPLFCVGVLVAVVPDLPDAWRGYRGQGIHGTLTVTSELCGKGGCDYRGNFVGSDGLRRVPHVLLQGGTHAVGDTVTTVLSKQDEVFIQGDGSTFFIGSSAAFAATLCLGGWTVWATSKVRTRGRLHPHAPSATTRTTDDQ